MRMARIIRGLLGSPRRLAHEGLGGFMAPIYTINHKIKAKINRRSPLTVSSSQTKSSVTRRGKCMGALLWGLIIFCITFQLNWYGDLMGYTGGTCGLTDLEISKMERLYRANAETASSFNMRLFAIDGSLLGAVREGGIIRHDQDMDTGMDARQEFIPQEQDSSNTLMNHVRDMIDQSSVVTRQSMLAAFPPEARHMSYMGYLFLRGINDGGNRAYLFEDGPAFLDPVNGSMYGSPVRYELVPYRCDRRVRHLTRTSDIHKPLVPNCVSAHVAGISSLLFENVELKEAMSFPDKIRREQNIILLKDSTDTGEWGEGGLSFWKLRNMADRSYIGQLLIWIGGLLGNVRSGEVSRDTMLQLPPRGEGLPPPNRSIYDSELYPQYPITVMWMNFLRLVASEEGKQIIPYVGGDSAFEKLFKVPPTCTNEEAFRSTLRDEYQLRKILLYPFFLAQLLFHHASRQTYLKPTTLDVKGAQASYESYFKQTAYDWVRYPTTEDVLKTRDWVRRENIGLDMGYPVGLQAFMDEHFGPFMSGAECQGACCPKADYSQHYPTWHDAMVDVAVTLVVGSSPRTNKEAGLGCFSIQEVIKASGLGTTNIPADHSAPLEIDSVLGGPALSREATERGIDVCGGKGFNDNGWINIASKAAEPVRYVGLSPQHPMTHPFRTYFAYEQPYFPFDHRLRKPPAPDVVTPSTTRQLIPTDSKPAPLFVATPLNTIQFIVSAFGESWRHSFAYKLVCFVQGENSP